MWWWTAQTRRALGGVVVVALIAACIGFALNMPTPVSSGSGAEQSRTTAPAPTEAVEDTAAPPVAEGTDDPQPSTTATVEPAPSPVRVETGEAVTLPEDGPGVTEPGVLLVATPQADGSVDVQETVYFADAQDVVTFDPADASRAGAVFDGEVRVIDLQVSDPGGPVVVPGSAITGELAIPVSSTDRVDLSYRVLGTVARSAPSATRRALMAVAPSVRVSDLPVQVLVPGPSVRNVTCPLLPVSERLCGAGTTPDLRVAEALPAAEAVVVAQVDLPRI